MKKLKLSPWHDGSVKPVRKGVYQRKYLFSVKYCFWTGKHFCWANDSVQDAVNDCIESSGSQDLKWRGVLK